MNIECKMSLLIPTLVRRYYSHKIADKHLGPGQSPDEARELRRTLGDTLRYSTVPRASNKHTNNSFIDSIATMS